MKEEEKTGGKVMAESKRVKTTVNISLANYIELKELVSKNVISSMTEGINLGVEMLIKEKRRELYAKKMAEAAKDKAFLERTLGSQRDFDRIEA